MKVILLVLIVFVNGQSQTAALVTESEEACQAKIAFMREKISEHNDKEADRIAYSAMSCAEPILARRGSDS